MSALSVSLHSSLDSLESLDTFLDRYHSLPSPNEIRNRPFIFPPALSSPPPVRESDPLRLSPSPLPVPPQHRAPSDRRVLYAGDRPIDLASFGLRWADDHDEENPSVLWPLSASSIALPPTEEFCDSPPPSSFPISSSSSSSVSLPPPGEYRGSPPLSSFLISSSSSSPSIADSRLPNTLCSPSSSSSFYSRRDDDREAASPVCSIVASGSSRRNASTRRDRIRRFFHSLLCFRKP